MNQIITIVDDEEDIAELVSLHLEKNKYKTLKYHDAKSFFDSLEKNIPDLIVLDLMLPDMDGTDICKELKSNKKYKKIPIIMLTAKQDEIDKIVGLEIGADDYMTKPFSPRELVARVKAVLRRGNIEEDEEDERVLNIDNLLFIDKQKHEIYDNNNKIINLTSTEFKILLILLKKRGWVFSRDKLLDKIWGIDKIVIDRTIDVHIKNLREKIGEAGKLIRNIRGVGYKLDDKK